MGAVPPLNVPGINQTQKRLIDERGGLESMAAALLPDLPASEASELFVDQWRKPVKRA